MCNKPVKKKISTFSCSEGKKSFDSRAKAQGFHKLKKVDKIAYIRFASVYREFADIEDFKNELKGLSEAKK
jgi:transcriptional regulator NrdR family protein